MVISRACCAINLRFDIFHTPNALGHSLTMTNLWRWITRQPQPEISVGVLRIHVLANFLQ